MPTERTPFSLKKNEQYFTYIIVENELLYYIVC